MTQPKTASSSQQWVWALVLLALVALRVPALMRPAGGDQHLYAYTAGRVLDGDMPYSDAWDQKPPGIFFVYATAWTIWPDARVIGVLDLVASLATAWLLMRLGRQMFGGHAGFAAAALFLWLADPGIQRTGGMYLRAQCETFIALAIAGAVSLTWKPQARPSRLIAVGVLLAMTFWLKYNAIVFAIPVFLAAIGSDPLGSRPWAATTIAWIAAGFLGASALVLLYFAAGGALTDLWLATITYNLRYAGETYTGAWDAAQYVFSMPVIRARVDGLWFLGLLGLLLLLVHRRVNRGTLVTAAWIAAAILAIAVNGSRGLPQYFIQATPVLALAGAAGLAAAWQERHRARAIIAITAVLVVAGLWRVGVQGDWSRPRLFGAPQAVENVMADLSYARGSISREAYLSRFDRGEGGKFSLLPIDRLVARIGELTSPEERAFVFGFAGGGALVKANRQSASRFFWSRAVVLEFESQRPGYGSAGLLADLNRTRPPVVALQKHDWGLAEKTTPDSIHFFMNNSQLRAWLEAGYSLDYEDAAFAVWRRKT